ncbi:hypothetical protein [Spongiactinospora sp. 9N601]|uniref:hypothetical protein n=1 Tax=Spongiactinospora sp. 9N601 TaxID=3375149 RepID=UPI0037B6B840
MSHRERAHFAALESTFPGWRVRVEKGWWWATKYAPPTAEQRAAGVPHEFARQGPYELAAALTVQLGILSRLGDA